MFISPSAAAGGKGNSKPGNARIHGMDKVLPSTICYAAIQVRISPPDTTLGPDILPLQAYITLSSSETWSESWKGVKLSRLYSLLREQFIHPEDPWCVETINWWNEFVPQPFLFIFCAHRLSEKFSAALSGQMKTLRKHCRTCRPPQWKNASTTNVKEGYKRLHRCRGVEVFPITFRMVPTSCICKTYCL